MPLVVLSVATSDTVTVTSYSGTDDVVELAVVVVVGVEVTSVVCEVEEY